MRLRKKRGGTLALVAAATITLILLGICFFFLAQIFGGEREIQHATDSGNLNVAKNALRRPDIPLNSGKEQQLYGQLGDRSLVNNAGPPVCPPVNLLTYDRLFAQCLLACINAKADPGPGQLGVQHAQEMVDILQSGDNSIGGRLSNELSKTSGNRLFSNFSDTGSQNSLRMLGANSSLGHVDSEFAVSYLEQTNADIGATNIEVLPSLRDLFPANLQSAIFTTKGSKTYLRGYVSPSVASGAGTPVGVPLQPGDQPHLVSNKTFDSQMTRGSAFANAKVPPNGFRSKSQANESRTNQNAATIACAEVGSLNLSFDFSAPYAYIKIVNGPDTGTGSASVPGPFAGLDHVLNNQLLNPGIYVAGPVFSSSLTLEQQWAAYNKAVKDGVNPLPPQPPLTISANGKEDKLYNLQGEPATVDDAKKIPFDNDGNLVMTHCTDENSTGWSRNDPDVIPQCWDLLGNGSGPGAFDKAYHPNAQYQDASAGTASGLLAMECAKCQLQHKFNTCGSLTVNDGNCSKTGLRVPMKGGAPWDKSSELPSAQMGKCKISQEGTVIQLGNWVKPGFGKQLEDFVAERARQINPKNGEAQARALLNQHTLNLGEIAYIYAQAPDNGKPDLEWSNNPPPWASSEVGPDGTMISETATYNLTQRLVNPTKDGGIHDIMYRAHPDANDPGNAITSTDVASWTPSTGWMNLLGRVQFTNTAAGTAAGFCKPD